MKIIKLNSSEQLDEYIRNNSIEVLGSGREGTCFLLSNNIVIKKLNDDYYLLNPNKFEDVNIPSFVFANGGRF